MAPGCGVYWSSGSNLMGMKGRAFLLPSRRRVRLSWSLGSDAGGVELDPGMRPTYLVANGFCDVVVSGVDDRGVGHIRRLAVFDNLAGLGAHEIGGGWSASLFSSVDPERYVYRMWDNPGNPRAVFVHFWGSREVQSLDTRTRALTVVAGPCDSGPALVVPDLADDYDFVWPRPHATMGHLYFFYGMQHRVLVLQDADRDGDLDQHFVLRALEDWSARGLDDASQYEQ